jgi:hypothetical protein
MPQVEKNMEFDLQQQIDIWTRKIKSEPSITESDSEELRSHLLDMIDQLKETGLDDEEAFWVASRRMGTSTDWGGAYKEANNPIIQIRRSALILAGVLVYFLFYHFIEFSSRLLLAIFLHEGVDGNLSVYWVSRYLLGSHFVIVLLLTSIYFLENRVISFIENIKLKPKHTILLLITTFILAIMNTRLSAIVKNLMNKDPFLIDYFIHIYRNFDYSFPLTVCLSFILIYSKYYKTAKY